MLFQALRLKKYSQACIFRIDKFLYVLSLRQGTILIAVHQIALTSFALIILLVAISHVGEMLSILHADMLDDAERRGLYDIGYGEDFGIPEGEGLSTNNQKRFIKAQYLASVTVILLYTSTILTSLYLMCCISLLYGAVKYKKEFVAPWIIAACIGLVFVTIGLVVGDRYDAVVNLCGGRLYYNCGAAVILFGYVYSLCAVCSFAVELNESLGVMRIVTQGGERMLLLDHTAQTNVVSTKQLHKLKMGHNQFV